MAIGLLSIADPAAVSKAWSSFKGRSFHTFYWPHEPVELAGKKVAVIGTGATGIQVIGEIADKVGELTVFQRRPNWSAPLNNGPISDEEMADIRARYDEIFDDLRPHAGRLRARAGPPRLLRGLARGAAGSCGTGSTTSPASASGCANFREIFIDEEANAEFSEYIADRIRQRVKDPAVAEKLIPKDHGFGVQRVPMETNYFEAYNRDNVRPGRHQRDADRAGHRDRPPHHRARLRVRHHRLRHRLRRHHRRLRPDRHRRRRRRRSCATSGATVRRPSSAC